MEFRPKKENWHKNKKDKKHKFSKYKPQGSNSRDKEENTSRVMTPTPVIDLADSSDDHDKFSKRKIFPNNWSEHSSENLSDFDEYEPIGANFEVLQNMSFGSSFLFKSEKEWEENQWNVNESDLNIHFKMNLNLLKAGLATIPFYKRMDYPSSLFTNEQIAWMNDKAEKKENIYQEVLKEFEDEKLKMINQSETGNLSTKETKSEVDEKDIKVDTADNAENSNNLNDNDNKPEPEPENETKANDGNSNAAEDSKRKDMEEWLDSILDP